MLEYPRYENILKDLNDMLWSSELHLLMLSYRGKSFDGIIVVDFFEGVSDFGGSYQRTILEFLDLFTAEYIGHIYKFYFAPFL